MGGSLYVQSLRLKGRPPPSIYAWLDRPVSSLQPSAVTKKLHSRLPSSEMQFYAENGHFAFFSSPWGA